MKRLLLALGLVVLASPAPAQNAITQEGSVIQNSPVMFRGNNRARQGAGVGGAATGQIVTTGDAVAGGRCDYSAPTDAAGGYYKLCLDAATGKITFGGTKTPELGLTLEINGTSYGFPGAGNGDVVGSASSLSGSLPVYNGTTGKLVRDSSIPFPPTQTSLANAAQINIGNYPENEQIPASIFQGLSVMVKVPSSAATAPWPNTAISGYITSANATIEATTVALFGFAGQTAAIPGTPFGMNVVVANCARLQCPDGSGFANGNLVGAEIDVDMRKIGAATPIGQLVGLFITGDSEAIPSNGAYGVRIKHLSPGKNLAWTIGYQTDDGAVTNAMLIGAAATTGASNSQPLIWKASTGSPIFMASTLLQTGVLDFVGNPDTGVSGIRALNIDARNAFRVNGVDAITFGGGCMNLLDDTAATIALCNTIPQNVHRNTAHVFQTLAGTVNLAKFQPATGASSTGMMLTVNNAAGVNLVDVTLGAVDSGGAGFKALRVPN